MTNKIKKSLFYQHDKSDCGIACLMMILKYYNRNRSPEELRYLSGTTKEGSTLLGLYQCANKIGFEAEGCKGSIEELEKSNNPIILRVLVDDLFHYVVFFYYDKKNRKYIIGDPAKGILKFDREELAIAWQGQYCLTAVPHRNYMDSQNIVDYKKDKRKFILGLLSKDKRILLHGLFFSLIISILGLSLSIYSQQLVDNILPSNNANKITWSIIVLGILLLVRVGLTYIKDTLFNFQNKSFNNRITNNFYTELLYLPKMFFNTRKIGDLVARINDTAKIQSLIHLFLNTYINDILTILVSTILVFFYSSQVGFIAICFIPILICLIINRSKSIIKKQRDVQIYYALTEANYISTILGITDIKNSNSENYFSQQNSNLFEDYQTKRFVLASTYVNLNAIINIFSIGLLITTICISIYSIKNGSLSIGDMIALLSISGLIISSTTNVSLLFIPFTEAKIAFERMYSVISIKNNKQDVQDKNIEMLNTIEAQSISFKYPGVSRNLYDSSTFILKKGTITAMTGNSGTGKTTLIDILTGNYPLSKGNVLYNGVDISTINKQSIQEKIRVVPQQVHIFNGSILFNIRMNESHDMDKLNLLFSKLDSIPFFNEFPQGINTIVGEEGITLSGGQKQIIGLLRALYDNPQFLILDEPTASLDSESVQLIYQLLKKIKLDSIILLISHDVSIFAPIIDETYKIKDSRINLIN